jgi:hypothetical protein
VAMRRSWPVVLLLCAAAAHAGNRTSYAGATEVNLVNRPLGSSPGIMLYFSHAMGGAGAGGLSKPALGLRLNRMHLVSGYFKADAPDPIQARELVNWHFGRGADNRIEFGRRLSWNLSDGSFGRRESDESAFTPPNRTVLARREPEATSPRAVPVFEPRAVSEPITAARRAHLGDLLDVRFDPLELRLDRRSHDARSSRQALH